MRDFSIVMAYTPRWALPGEPFTESSFTRRTFELTYPQDEVGLVLVDLWNVGWDDGPRMPSGEPLYERGASHARRKREIIEQVIQPTLAAARRAGVQVFHGNSYEVLRRYPQWVLSTTAAERETEEERLRKDSSKAQGQPKTAATPYKSGADPAAWPPPEWVEAWRKEHAMRLYGQGTQWDRDVISALEQHPLDIPGPVQPIDGEWLISSNQQFRRLLQDLRIRVLFFAGFEADQCLQFKGYGIANVQLHGYLCNAIRDATTTYEVAETLAGMDRTRCAIDMIEERWGYSTTSDAFIRACDRCAAGA